MSSYRDPIKIIRLKYHRSLGDGGRRFWMEGRVQRGTLVLLSWVWHVRWGQLLLPCNIYRNFLSWLLTCKMRTRTSRVEGRPSSYVLAFNGWKDLGFFISLFFLLINLTGVFLPVTFTFHTSFNVLILCDISCAELSSSKWREQGWGWWAPGKKYIGLTMQ